MHITNMCNLLTRGWSIKPYTYFKPNIQFFVFVFLISETKYTCESRRYRDISDRSTRTQNMQEGSYRIFLFLCDIGLMRQGWKFLASPTATMRKRKRNSTK